MTAFLGSMAALAFVLGILFLLVRVLRGVRELPGSVSPGPRLQVLGRAGLSPRQGVATVQVGERTLVVGYGEGGVRFLADVSGDSPAEGRTRGSDEPGEERHSISALSGDRLVLSGRKQSPAWIRRAMGRVGVLALSLTLIAGSAAPGAGAVPGPGTPVALGLAAAPLAREQTGPQVTEPRVDGPREPGAPGMDFPSLEVSMGDGSGDDLRITGPVGTVLFIGFLTLLPTLLLLMTSFTRILVVLHLLKQAIGTQTAPPAHLLAAMALLLTAFVMAPTLREANETAVRPWMDGEMDEVQMLQAGAVPFRTFMLERVRDSDLRAFVEMQAPETPPETVDDISLVVVTSAFVTGELRSAFQMGFALFLPFVIIDIVVASVLMSMGMFMLPPVMVSLPFKLLLFVMVDGWALVVGSLVRSFA